MRAGVDALMFATTNLQSDPFKLQRWRRPTSSLAPTPTGEEGQHDQDHDYDQNHDQGRHEKVIWFQNHWPTTSTLYLCPARHAGSLPPLTSITSSEGERTL